MLAGLLLIPSIAAVTAQVLARRSVPLLFSAEVVYPWVVALLATSLFAGLGMSRRLIPEIGLGRRRAAASIGFALVSTTLIGVTFAGVSLADDAALQGKPASDSRFGPTSAALTPPQCDQKLTSAFTSTVEMDLWGDVDRSSMGSLNLNGQRADRDFKWTAQVIRSDLFGQFGAARISGKGWLLEPGKSWQSVDPRTLDSDRLDAVVLENALTLGNRATAEDRGLEYVEGARSRHCRIAIDGPAFAASFPQVQWLTKNASLQTWRGELDYWVFGDGQVGMVTGSVNGDAQGILPHGVLATVNVRMTATDRNGPVSIMAP